MAYILVFLGAGIGGILRQSINQSGLKVLGNGFPYSTMAINCSGSLVMGLIVGYFTFKAGGASYWRLFLTTGVLGGFTTFSAFSLDAILLFERGEIFSATVYVIGSVGISLLTLFAGLSFVRYLA